MKKLLLYIIPLILLSACVSSYQVNNIDVTQQKFTTEYTKEDPLIEHYIQPYRLNLESKMNGVIAHALKTMNKAQPESSLGNLLADATFKMAEKYSNKAIDAAIINYGGIRVPSINEGEVTLGNVYEIMPFDNYLVTLELSGTILQEVCNVIASNGGWPVSGLSFTIKNNKATNIKIKGENLSSNTIYNIAISDYLAGGGDNLEMLKNLSFENTNVILRDAFIEYFTITKKLSADIENRITNE